jgi:hypothetical protein
MSLNQDPIPANSAVRLAYLLIEIHPSASSGGAFEDAPSALPVNIAFVVDKSDSMCIPILSQEQFEELARMGAVSETTVDGVAVWHFENVPASHKINAPRNVDFVKRALHSALEKLAPRDRFSLVAFAREARVLIQQESGQNKRALLKVIDQLEDLQLGNETFMAAGMAQGYEQVQHSFSREMVNRMIVLTDGFTLDAPQCQFLAQQAAQAGISISTLGLGVEFNEELLIALADSSGGNAYFIRDPAEIPDAFDRELSGVQNVVLRDLNLKLRLMHGTELRRAHRVKPIIADLGALPLSADRSLDLPLGELSRGGEIALLFELLAPPRPPGTYQLAHLIVEYNQPSLGLQGQKIRQDCIIHYEGNGVNAPVNPRVMNIVEKVSAFKLQTRALEDAARGDVAGATQKLKAAATRLINMGEQDLAQAALNEAANLEQRGQMSAAGTKRLRYDTRRLTQKLG